MSATSWVLYMVVRMFEVLNIPLSFLLNTDIDKQQTWRFCKARRLLSEYLSRLALGPKPPWTPYEVYTT